MSAAPRLIDRAALRARLARSVAAGGGPDFLRRRIAEDFADRLAATLRPFPTALDLASSGPEIIELLRLREGSASRAGAAGQAGAATLVDPDALPFGPEAFDLVVSSLAFHLVDDLPGLLTQIRRSLRPDGLFLAALLGGDTLTELRQSFAAAEAEIEGGASPRVVPFGDIRAFGGLLQRAGFALPVTDVDRVTVRYPDPLALMRDLRAWGATNMLAERRRTPLKRATLVRAIEIYGEKFADPDGRVRATFEIVWLSGWAPHPEQQKPLKPGSATTRLADALGVKTGEGPAS
ncbi:MAG: methyltransferase domain-containing protein [Hansschlegelia sp.]